jgi:hypothetical protein
MLKDTVRRVLVLSIIAAAVTGCGPSASPTPVPTATPKDTPTPESTNTPKPTNTPRASATPAYATRANPVP